MTTIYIPTLGRATGSNPQPTATALAGTRWASDVVLVAPARDCSALPGRTLVCPPHIEGQISRKRQWILDYAAAQDETRVFMFDDDLKFETREGDKYRASVGDELDIMMASLEILLDNAPFVGVTSRFMANQMKVPVTLNGRLGQAYGIDLEAAADWNWRMDRVPYSQDTDYVLQVLVSGYDIPILTTFCKGGPTNAPGGCSIDRTAAKHRAAIETLLQIWPQYLTRTERKGWKGWDDTLTDVRVSRAKARADGDTNRDMLGLPREKSVDWAALLERECILRKLT